MFRLSGNRALTAMLMINYRVQTLFHLLSQCLHQLSVCCSRNQSRAIYRHKMRWRRCVKIAAQLFQLWRLWLSSAWLICSRRIGLISSRFVVHLEFAHFERFSASFDLNGAPAFQDQTATELWIKQLKSFAQHEDAKHSVVARFIQTLQT